MISPKRGDREVLHSKFKYNIKWRSQQAVVDDCFYNFKIYFSTLSVGSFCSNSAWFEVPALLTYFPFLFLRKEQHVKKTKGIESRNLPAAQHIYICICTLYTYTIHMYAIATVHLNIFWALQVSCFDTWAHIQLPPMQCVCVCVHTPTQHMHIKPLST